MCAFSSSSLPQFLQHSTTRAQALTNLLEALSASDRATDLCGNVARLLAENVMHFVGSAATYAATEEDRLAAGGADITTAIDGMLRRSVVPMLPRLTEGRDSLTLYAQKILAMILLRYALDHPAGRCPCHVHDTA
jgi:hypothetical protein